MESFTRYLELNNEIFSCICRNLEKHEINLDTIYLKQEKYNDNEKNRMKIIYSNVSPYQEYKKEELFILKKYNKKLFEYLDIYENENKSLLEQYGVDLDGLFENVKRKKNKAVHIKKLYDIDVENIVKLQESILREFKEDVQTFLKGVFKKDFETLLHDYKKSPFYKWHKLEKENKANTLFLKERQLVNYNIKERLESWIYRLNENLSKPDPYKCIDILTNKIDLRHHVICGHRQDIDLKHIYIYDQNKSIFEPDITFEQIQAMHYRRIKLLKTHNYIEEELEYLYSDISEFMVLAVLLDLFCNLKIVVKGKEKVNFPVQKGYKKKDKSLNKDDLKEKDLNDISYINRLVEFKDKVLYTYEEPKNLNKTIKKSEEKIKSGEYLYPFIPIIEYIKKKEKVFVSESFAEIHTQFAFNTDIKKFFGKFDPKGTQYKSFNKAYEIYSGVFKDLKFCDYYCIESIMGFNLSMKLYDSFYEWVKRDVAEIKKKNKNVLNKEEKLDNPNELKKIKKKVKKLEKKELEKLEKEIKKEIEEIISLVLEIKSPYLRLKVVDIVLQSYSYPEHTNNNIKLVRYSLKKFLKNSFEKINEKYGIIYDVLMFCIGNDLVNKEFPDGVILNKMEEYITSLGKSFIKIMPNDIEKDIKHFPELWGTLAFYRRGKHAIYDHLYHNIVYRILENSHSNFSKNNSELFYSIKEEK